MYATDGDDTLGGSDFDLCLAKILKDRIHALYDVDITATVAAVPGQVDAAEGCEKEGQHSADMCTAAVVHTKAEEIKKGLTYLEEVQFNCTLPAENKVYGCLRSVQVLVRVVAVCLVACIRQDACHQ